MSLHLADAPAVLRGLLRHQVAECDGPWMVTREPHPSDATVGRLLLTCPACQARHLYDVRKLDTGGDRLHPATEAHYRREAERRATADATHLRVVR